MLAKTPEKNIFAVVGGMGPLASAEFLKTIYEHHLGEHEQNSPIVIMYSDPTFPDRTESFLAGAYDVLTERLILMLTHLRDMGASRILICCVTIHYLLPRLPAALREKIISLLDVIFADLARTRKRHLLLCTTGTMNLRLFQTHECWESTRDYVVLPTASDQELIHNLIYRIKQNHVLGELIPPVELLLEKYGVDSFIAGCTEMHLLAKHFMSAGGGEKKYGCVDPLDIVAKELGGKRP